MREKVSAIIQARMTSSRLPGKVLMEVKGKPLLAYQIEQLRFAESLDKLIVATTVNSSDDLIAAYAADKGIPVFRGSEEDVLDRYYQAACNFKCHHIMRLTADCPLIDPDVCDQLRDLYYDKGVAYAKTAPSFAEGLDCEIFNYTALETAWKNARLKSEREHVTLYFKNHPELFSIANLENVINDCKYRITVDRQEDFELIKAVIEFLYKEGRIPIHFSDIRTFLDENMQIFFINKDIVRNEGLIGSLEADDEIKI
jgi:spore coat polysaccharide biosynthesis protein SpsF